MSKSKLKTCPFCGEFPELHVWMPSDTEEAWFQLSCENEKCVIKPYTDYYPKKFIATRCWNKRWDD